MSWLDKLGAGAAGPEDKKLLQLRVTQFERLLYNYGQILDLIANAAEKQGGGFVLDRQYIVALADDLFNLAKAVVFDAMVLANKRHLFCFDLLQRFEVEARAVLARGGEEKEKPSAPVPREDATKAAVNAETLARAIAQHSVLYQGSGQVAARGVAAGTVFNLKTGGVPEEFPAGGIWVDADLNQAVNLIQVIGKVTAILIDRGDPGDYACRLARSYRVPTLVGMKDVTERLSTGEPVTVDAEENTVYQGLIPELPAYYRERSGPEDEDEFEYRLLREFRRLVFPLTISNVRNRHPWASDLKTLHDLVHLAHELAGEALARLAVKKRMVKKCAVELEAGVQCSVLAVDLRATAELSGRPEKKMNLNQVGSPVLEAFLSGVKDYETKSGRSAGRKDAGRVIAAVMNQQANLLLPGLKGFDMVDAALSGNPATNSIYCRFDSRWWDLNQKFVCRDAVLDILSRLDFSATETNRGVTAWITRLERADVQAKLTILGRLWAWVKEKDRTGWQRAGLSNQIEAFVQQYTRLDEKPETTPAKEK